MVHYIKRCHQSKGSEWNACFVLMGENVDELVQFFQGQTFYKAKDSESVLKGREQSNSPKQH